MAAGHRGGRRAAEGQKEVDGKGGKGGAGNAEKTMAFSCFQCWAVWADEHAEAARVCQHRLGLPTRGAFDSRAASGASYSYVAFVQRA